MSDDPLRVAVRRASRRRGITENDRCAWCDIQQPDLVRRVARPLLEAHHVVGFANDPEDTVMLCLNCHWLATIAQQDDLVPLRPAQSKHERARASITAAASLIKAAAEQLQRNVDVLNEPDAPIRARPRRSPSSRSTPS